MSERSERERETEEIYNGRYSVLASPRRLHGIDHRLGRVCIDTRTFGHVGAFGGAGHIRDRPSWLGSWWCCRRCRDWYWGGSGILDAVLVHGVRGRSRSGRDILTWDLLEVWMDCRHALELAG